MLGQVIRQYREARGWKQSTLAAKSGLTQSYISNLERGARGGTLDALQALALALEVPLDELIKAAGADLPPPELPELPGTEDLPPGFAYTIQRLRRYLTPRAWERLAAYAEGLAAERADAAGMAYGHQVAEGEGPIENALGEQTA